MKVLKIQDILALSFMTFALFLGAGNIIFPPMVGLQSGPNVWIAELGFLATAVCLPVIAVIALAKVGGGMDALSHPLGKFASSLLAAVAYLAVGPLFAIPRTATVSFEVGVAPLTGVSPTALLIYSSVYFMGVLLVSLYPGRLLDTVGRFLAPLKIIALSVLGIAAFIFPAGEMGVATPEYATAPFSQGFTRGYLTMDSLAALVFGIIIVNAIRSRGVESPKLITRYAIIAGLIAGLGLALVYTSLFRLGSGSYDIASSKGTGASVLHAYVQHTFGSLGSGFLAVLISLACLVTAVGLTCACSEYFSRILPLSQKTLVVIMALFSLFVSNLGLAKLIAFSEPVMTAIYPPCIVLVVLSFCKDFWWDQRRIVGPVMLVSFIFGCVDALKNVVGLLDWISAPLKVLPLSEQGMAWLAPSLMALFIAAAVDRMLGKRS